MATIHTESFETDGNGTRYTTSVPEFSDGAGDFFTRTDGGNISGAYEVTGADGSFYFAGQDIDGEGASAEQSLTIAGLDIAGFTNLALDLLIAEDDDGSNQDWDLTDSFKVAARMDGGGFTDVFAVESVPDGDAFNAVPAVDTDFDGDGDGTEITDAFAGFEAAIAGTGTTLDLRFTWDLNSGDEDLAIDRIEVTGDSAGGGDTTAPTIVGLTPADDSTDVATDAAIVLEFDEPVVAGTGDIVIRRDADDAAVETIDVTSSAVTVSGATVTVDPAADLAPGTGFYVEVVAGAIEDAAGNPFAGISGTTTFNFSTATPVPAVIINEVLFDPATGNDGDANGDGTRDFSEDEFVEIVNTGSAPADLSDWTLSDDDGDDFAFPAGTTLAAGQAAVLFGGGTPTGDFGGALVFTDDGSIGSGLANSGDLVELRDAGGTLVDSLGYGSAGPVGGGSDQSITRDPDLTGAFADHAGATGSGGARFSPGTQVDGTPFGGAAGSIAINELRVNAQSGDDTNNFLELFSTNPATSLDGLTAVVVSGEFGPGQIDFAFDLTGGGFDADGVFLLGGSDLAPGDPGDIFPSGGFDPFGSPQTVLIVEGFTGSAGNDLDTNDDGVLDTTPWTDVIDSVSLIDGDANTDRSYSSTVIGPDGNFLPAQVAAIPDGSDSFNIGSFFSTANDTPGALNVPAAPATVTPISSVQGAGAASPLVGDTVTVEAVVVGDFQEGDADDTRNLEGFYLQEETADSDGDPATSEGIFVFDGSNPAIDVSIGDVVEVTGTVEEFFDETQIAATSVSVVSQGASLPGRATIDLPSAGTVATNSSGDLVADLEAFEGMLVRFSDTLTVTEMFNLDRFNEIKLSEGGRLRQFTQDNAPSTAGYAAHLEDIASRTITYDDGKSEQNVQIGELVGFGPTFSTATDIRMGDTIDDLTGVLTYDFSQYRVRATEDGENSFDKVNTRPAAPESVGSDFTVASVNVLNYFTTIDGSGLGSGPNALGPRGADSTTEFERQTDKLVEAMLGLGADVFGLVELENEFANLNGDGTFAIRALVDALNAELGATVYDYVDPGRGFVDTGDAISNGFVYDTTTTGLAGAPAILDDSVLPSLGLSGPIFDGQSTNRASLAASFEELASGEVFTAAVNHFKSKGSIFGGDTNPATNRNAAQGDGQGNNNLLRTEAATALDTWLATDPTGAGDGDLLILGDLNAYAEEDPITTLEGAGYTDLVEQFVGPDASSFVFDGQAGTLDYALANPSMLTQVTGATEWAINADEPDAIDYNLDFGRDPAIFDGSVPFRFSDHDPILVGLELGTPPSEIAANSQGFEQLTGTPADERFVSDGGGLEYMIGGGGIDIFDFTAMRGNGLADAARVVFDDNDLIEGFDLAELTTFTFGTTVYAYGGAEMDLLILDGVSALSEDDFLGAAV